MVASFGCSDHASVVAGSGPGGCVELGAVSGSLWHWRVPGNWRSWQHRHREDVARLEHVELSGHPLRLRCFWAGLCGQRPAGMGACFRMLCGAAGVPGVGRQRRACHVGTCLSLSVCGRLGPPAPRQGAMDTAAAGSGQQGPCPALAWSCRPCAVPRRAWTCLGPLVATLLKLSLPLFSLPPQDPGFASQALINKKLNDYRKVRYGLGGGGHRDPSALYSPPFSSDGAKAAAPVMGQCQRHPASLRGLGGLVQPNSH